MESPNVWIGIGAYGDAFLQGAAAKLGVLRLLGTVDGAGQPIFCHLATNAEGDSRPTHPEIAYLDASLGSDCGSQVKQLVNKKLPAAIRKGNRRGTGFFFIFGHAEDIVDCASIDWLWRLPAELAFNLGYIALVVATEPPAHLSGHELDVWRHQLAPRLSGLAQDMQEGQNDFRHQLVILNPTGEKASLREGADGDPSSASVESMVLLFELLASMEEDPIKFEVLKALMVQPEGAINVAPTCASFGIHTLGVKFPDIASAAGRTADEAILSSIKSGQTPTFKKDAPSIDITAPEVPDEIKELNFAFQFDPLEELDASVTRLDTEAARLAVDSKRWWHEEASPTLPHAESARIEAGTRLREALSWFDGQVWNLWVAQKAPAHEIADALEKQRLQLQRVDAGEDRHRRMTALTLPDLSAFIQRLRRALLSRARPRSTLLFLLILAGAASVSGYAASVWLSREVSTLDFIATGWVRIAIVLSMVIVTLEPAWRWLLHPMRRIWQALEGVQAITRQARKHAKEVRVQFARHVAAVARGAVSDRLGRELALAEQRFRDLSATVAVASGRHASVLSAEQLSTDLLERPLPARSFSDVIPSSDQLVTQFRKSYIPTAILSPTAATGPDEEDRPMQFAPGQMSDVLDLFFRKATLRSLLSAPLADLQSLTKSDLVAEPLANCSSPGAAEPVAGVFLSEQHKAAVADIFGEPKTHACLRRGDKVFALGVAVGMQVAEAVQ